MQTGEPDATDTAKSNRRRPRRTTRHACRVCSESFMAENLLPASLVREHLAALIGARVSGWDGTGFICRGCLNGFRADYVRGEMEKDRGELSALEEEVVKSLHDGALVTDDLNLQFDASLTLGERISDRVSEFGGSWRFIMIFFGVMTVWIVLNSIALLFRPFDPFPYILLNLALSLLAAVQAPIILMSQNRQESRDRLRAENDYQVNLKAELEIRAISEKLDQLIHHQWERLLEIQQIQMEMIEDALARKP
jgi:uncharacterized membrane protein